MTTTATTQAARELGRSNTPVVPIALGAMLMGTRTPEDESRRILDHYLGEVAPRYVAPDGTPAKAMIDTADCYCWWEAPGDEGGHSESVLGRWMADAGVRERVFLATKGTARIEGFEQAWGDHGADWEYARDHFVGASAGVLEESLTASLERLSTGSIDLYYVHVDDRSTPLEETLSFLASAVADGRIGAYGYSNVRTWRLSRIRALCEANGWPQPVALQQQHSYLRRRAGAATASIVDDEQLDYLGAHPDLQLVAYSPVLKGLYSDAAKRDDDFWAMGPYAGPDAAARLDAVDQVAREAGATGNQVVLQWLLAQGSPRVLPLIGPRTFDQYMECIEALDVALTAEQVELLTAAGA